MKLKDKRVDKMLAWSGFKRAEVFYSPISSSLLLFSLLIGGGGTLWFLNWKFLYFIIPYFLFFYLLHAFQNNSFALHEDKLLVINPNFPFRRFQVIKRSDVRQVVIDKQKNNQWSVVFLAGGANYLSVETHDRVFRFHCAGLDLDAFDENWTEKTIEDLHFKLEQHKFPTVFNIKD